MTTLTWDPPEAFKRDLLDRYGLTCPPRWGTPRHPEYPTYGPAVGRIMTRFGTPPMPWQQYVLDVSLEIDPANTIMHQSVRNHDGLAVPQATFVHRKVGLSICRQQGKTASVLALATHRLLTWSRQVVTYAAQTRQDARSKWEDDFVETVEGSILAKRFRVRKNNGFEALIAKQTRSMMGITSNTEKAGHGATLDLGLIDEAFSHQDARLEQAMSPAMLTRPNAQLWWLSAGGTDTSFFLNEKRASGRQIIEDYWRTGVIENVAHFEWLPDEKADASEPETWFTCMPALCPDPPCKCDAQRRWRHSTTVPLIKAELRSMALPDFERAYLNRTKKATQAADPNIPTKEWPLCASATSRVNKEALSFGIDVTPQRDHGSIAVYSFPNGDGRGHGELVAYRPGIDWIPGALRWLKEKWNPIAIGFDTFTGTPGNALKDAVFKLRNLEGDPVFTTPDDPDYPYRGQLWIPTLNDVVAASGQFVDEVRKGKINHPDQIPLNLAVGGARTRRLGDAWALARREASVDISPLVALILARAAHLARIGLVEESSDDPSAMFL